MPQYTGTLTSWGNFVTVGASGGNQYILAENHGATASTVGYINYFDASKPSGYRMYDIVNTDKGL
jgi:hypothetical protein